MRGNTGLNCHLSELISHIIDPISFEQDGNEVDSTDDLLHKVLLMNEKIVKGELDSEKPECKASVNSEPDIELTTDAKDTSFSRHFKAGDIRNFGVKGRKTNDNSDETNQRRLKERIASLRKSRQKDTVLPNLSDRLKAGRLMDLVEGGQTVKLPEAADTRCHHP